MLPPLPLPFLAGSFGCTLVCSIGDLLESTFHEVLEVPAPPGQLSGDRVTRVYVKACLSRSVSLSLEKKNKRGPHRRVCVCVLGSLSLFLSLSRCLLVQPV